ncbi:MAG TPA: hypothetical protein VIK86_05740 [Candidatus Paceibacterota bacterium]
MKTLISILFYQKLTKSSTKKFKRNFKKKNAPSISILQNLGLIIYEIVKFIFNTLAPKKSICQETVSLNVINLNKYKLKKSQKKENVQNVKASKI